MSAYFDIRPVSLSANKNWLQYL